MIPLLTVAIPHYNNVSGLLATLNEVLNQHCPNLEVIVVDNATGRSIDIAKGTFEDGFPKVSFFKNKTNIGYDANVDRCVRKSRGKFVWLLGAGDIPEKNAIKHLQKIINAYPQATNILLDVITDISFAKKDANHCLFTSQLIEPTKNKLFLTDLYRSALSGNVVNRSSWLEASTEPLAFSNWCHAERALQMHANVQRNSFAVNAHHIGVFVIRESEGWWNNSDLSFLHNVLLHRKILIYYGSKLFKNHQLPSHCKPFSLVIIKAMLYSRSISKPASETEKVQVAEMIRDKKMLFIPYKIIQLLPKAFLKTVIHCYKICKNNCKFFRQ